MSRPSNGTLRLSDTHVVRFDDGAETVGESWGSGAVILCVHGIASSRKSWERFGERFAGAYRTIAYDQRGHGDSAHVEGPMTHARSVADARAVAASLGEPLAAIVGHSWGGAIAILAGAELDARAVVAVDPMIAVQPQTWAADYADDVAADLALDDAAREAELRRRLHGWHESDVAGKIHALHAMQPAAVERLGSENGVDAGAWNLRDVVRAYPKPLFVAAAAPGDSVMNADDLAVLHGAPNVSVVEFEGHGHNLHRTDFERFTAEVERFFSRVL